MGDNKMTNGMATSRRNFIKGAGISASWDAHRETVAAQAHLAKNGMANMTLLSLAPASQA